MERYINADELIKAMRNTGMLDCINDDVQFNSFFGIPFEEIETVKHGAWIDISPPPRDEYSLPEYFEYKCSVCGKGYVVAKTPYCYHCGAKMDG